METRKITTFNEVVWEYYRTQGRHDLPWRLPEADGTFDPYKIIVSEMMLQQTQVPRVLPKYIQFLETFPSTYALAHATLGEVLASWSGLGYNRRAKFLRQTAQAIEREHIGVIPDQIESLIKLPGIGPNTAGAIVVYAFNRPVTFVETNIRSVFIHHFFAEQDKVPDEAIKQLVAEAIDMQNSREWYWALMDYGTHLKQMTGNVARASEGYVKQAKFAGSRRQLRGQVIRLLLERAQTIGELSSVIEDERLQSVLKDLLEEGLIQRTRDTYALF